MFITANRSRDVGKRRLRPTVKRKIAIVGCVLFGWVASTAADDHVTVHIGVTLFDGTGAPPLGDAAVVVRDDRIAAVGRRQDQSVPSEARVIDHSGRWMIPGLIDAHVHLTHSASLYTQPGGLDLRAYRAIADERARTRATLHDTFARYVASGITGVVDRGGAWWSLDNRDLAGQLRPQHPAPRVVVAGPMLATYQPTNFAGDEPSAWHVETAAQARAAVAALAARGVDMVKVHFLPTGPLADAMAWFEAAVDAARKAGLRVVVHATDAALARAVVEAGADGLVHSIDDRAVSATEATLLAARGTVYTTTLLVHEGYREVFRDGVRFSAMEKRLGDPDAIDSLDDLASIPRRALPAWLGQLRYGRGGRLATRARLPYYLARDTAHVMAENLRLLVAAGVIIAAGTDAGTVGNLHGPSLHRELALMVDAGLTPARVLVAATQGGAAAMGRSGDLGTITVGKLADMVVLNADPLADIAHAGDIHRVIIGGHSYDPAAIAKHLAH